MSMTITTAGTTPSGPNSRMGTVIRTLRPGQQVLIDNGKVKVTFVEKKPNSNSVRIYVEAPGRKIERGEIEGLTSGNVGGKGLSLERTLIDKNESDLDKKNKATVLIEGGISVVVRKDGSSNRIRLYTTAPRSTSISTPEGVKRQALDKMIQTPDDQKLIDEIEKRHDP